MDEEEKRLYILMIEAEYNYFKYIEPLRLAAIHQKLIGRVKNPFHWLSQLEDKEETKSVSKTNKSNYKELCLVFHPNKNPDRITEATWYFQYIMKWIEEDKQE